MKPQKEKGFTLIEVSIALVILALIVGWMLGIFWQEFNIRKQSEERTVAYSLAREVIEEYSDWGRLTARAGTPPANGVYTNPPAPVTFNNLTYTPRLTISDGPCVSGISGCPPNNELKQISVTITWGTKSFTLTTLKANY